MHPVLREEIDKFGRCGPLGLLRLGWRYLRLMFGPWPRSPAPESDGMRVVVSLSTIPSRVHLLRPALASLLDQTRPPDQILLNLPHRCRRDGCEYPSPVGLPPQVTVRRCEHDWGPATKLLPTLEAETGPDTLLVAVDDDNIYPPDLVENLVRWSRELPQAALGYRGWRLSESLDWKLKVRRYGTALDHPLEVDVVTGTWGLAVRPHFFDAEVFDFSAYPEAAYFVDDIWFNGHLARRGVPRFLVPRRLPPLPTPASIRGDLGRSKNSDGHHNNLMIQAFREYWCRAER